MMNQPGEIWTGKFSVFQEQFLQHLHQKQSQRGNGQHKYGWS
jgi:hypothetical protein